MIKKMLNKLTNLYMVEVTQYGSRGKVYFYINIKDKDKLMDAVQIVHNEWWKKIPESIMQPSPVISNVNYFKVTIGHALKIKLYGTKVRKLADGEPFIWYC